MRCTALADDSKEAFMQNTNKRRAQIQRLALMALVEMSGKRKFIAEIAV